LKGTPRSFSSRGRRGERRSTKEKKRSQKNKKELRGSSERGGEEERVDEKKERAKVGIHFGHSLQHCTHKGGFRIAKTHGPLRKKLQIGKRMTLGGEQREKKKKRRQGRKDPKSLWLNVSLEG